MGTPPARRSATSTAAHTDGADLSASGSTTRNRDQASHKQNSTVAAPGANPANFLTVEEVVDVARYLLHTGDNVKLGPQILLRTMRNPMGGYHTGPS